jgi:hypothetical protein
MNKKPGGLRNKHARQGTWADAWLRKRMLKKQKRRLRLPKKNDLPRLEIEARRYLSQAIGELGLELGWGERVSVRPPQGSPRSRKERSGGGPR